MPRTTEHIEQNDSQNHAHVNDLTLPTTAPYLSKIKSAGIRSFIYSLLLAGAIVLLPHDMVLPIIAQGLTAFGIDAPSLPHLSKYVSGIVLTMAAIFTAFGGFAIFLPDARNTISAFQEKHDKATAIAQQVTLSDGIMNTDRRRAATETVSQAPLTRYGATASFILITSLLIFFSTLPWAALFALVHYFGVEHAFTFAGCAGIIAIKGMMLIAFLYQQRNTDV